MAEYFADGHLRYLDGEWRDDSGNIVEVQQVVHGKWIKPTPCSQEHCNQCGLTPKMLFGVLPAHCPHCGTQMDGGVVKLYESKLRTNVTASN